MATKYRVFRVSPTLLKAVRAKRDANPGITTKMILDAACSESLPCVVRTLQSIGCKMSKSKVVVKWPVDPELLARISHHTAALRRPTTRRADRRTWRGR
jgi:hypothetical protein